MILEPAMLASTPEALLFVPKASSRLLNRTLLKHGHKYEALSLTGAVCIKSLLNHLLDSTINTLKVSNAILIY